MRDGLDAAAIPSPDAVGTGGDGAVVWHRDGLRTADHPAVAAAAEHDAVLPLFVFDPGFYGADGLACDARVRFLHESLADLDDRYHTASGGTAGLGYVHGDPVAVVRALDAAGWTVIAARSPTGRHGLARDRRAAEAGVEFVAGGGLTWDAAGDSRDGWRERVAAWLAAEPHDPPLGGTAVASVETDVTVDGIEDRYGIAPTKRRLPTGGRSRAREALSSFVDRIGDYPGSISAPLDARAGTSGLSPYLTFGCLSVREVHRHVTDRVPESHARDAFVSRLYWNRHYAQKLLDWPGWLDEAVNPALAGFNRDRRDDDLIAAWKRGRTGYPMVDAAMRCLAGSGWLNFRMRAMAVSAYFHVLAQPWRIGADWFHHHLVDSDAAINYTQWQSQCGLVGKPNVRVYDPRKQVRDHDPEGEWIRRWVPELEALPAAHLDRPEHTPPAVQERVGVEIGADYPRPVVAYEPAVERFWRRREAVEAAAAARLGEDEIAARASLSGGRERARRIAAEHGDRDDDGTRQTDLAAFGRRDDR
jgi:deoxyribodipyrimidine photo-lyase